jgi:hypothetical protein
LDLRNTPYVYNAGDSIAWQITNSNISVTGTVLTWWTVFN